ncbi:hypothetical protein KUTeg_002040, partial [Tegillarca granosa]
MPLHNCSYNTSLHLFKHLSAVDTIFHSNIEFHQQQIFTEIHKTQNGDNYIDEIIGEEYDAFVIHPWAWKEPELEVPWYVMVYRHSQERLLSSMNMLLIGIAVSDTLTVLLPTPLLLYLYAINNIPEVPYDLCRPWDYLTKYAPVVTHSASVFITLCLAVHRYICVCYPFYARRMCTRRKSALAITISYFVSVLIHLCRFFDTEYLKITVQHSVRNETITICRATHAKWLQGNEIVYECIYYWVYITIVKLVPCFSIIVFDTVMLKQMRKADNRRIEMASESGSEHQENGRHRHKESRRITWIIICIVGIVCLVELPLAIVLIIWTITILNLNVHLPEVHLAKASLFLNLLIYASYPIIFLFYCFMSRRFKNGVKNLF